MSAEHPGLRRGLATLAAAALLVSACTGTSDETTGTSDETTGTSDETTGTSDETTGTASGLDGDHLSVSRVGDGAQAGNVAVPVHIDQLSGSGEELGVLEMPTRASGDQRALTLGADRDQAGALQRSEDGEHLLIGGYDAEPGWEDAEGGTSLNGSFAEDVPRVVGIIDAEGDVDTSTSVGGAYTERHIRGVASTDGLDLWIGGHGGDTEGAHRGGVLHTTRGADSPTPITGDGGQVSNVRVPLVHDGQLYVSSDRDDCHGINSVGARLPTESAEMTTIASPPEGISRPHDFAFVGEHLYVTYHEDEAAIVRYAPADGASWEPEAMIPGEFWGITGRGAGEDNLLYAVRDQRQDNELVALLDEVSEGAGTGEVESLDVAEEVVATAGPGYAYRGVAFTPGHTPSTEPVEIAESALGVDWDVRVADGQGDALSAVRGAETNPQATGTLTGLDEAGVRPEDLTVTASSQDTEILADEDIDVDLAADGTFTVSAAASSSGMTTITVTVTDPEGAEVSSRLDYWVSDPLPDDTAYAHIGMADASTAQDVGDGHMLVADDDSNAVRLFGPSVDEPVAEFDLTEGVEPIQPGRGWDLEASARIDDVIYWTGSVGNSRSGNLRPDRDLVIATRVTGAGAETQLQVEGYSRGFQDALVAWDEADGHGMGAGALMFERAVQEGWSAEGPNSLNVEGAAMAPDGESLWMGFRSPLTPLEHGDTALIVEFSDIAGTTVGGGEPEITRHISLDLDGRAIRGMADTDDGDYLIQAGSADDAGDFALYGWTGNPEDEPVEAQNPLGLEGWAGSYESLPQVDSLADGTVIRVLQDAGTVDIYGTGTEAQDLPREMMKFPSHDYVLDFDGAFGNGD